MKIRIIWHDNKKEEIECNFDSNNLETFKENLINNIDKVTLYNKGNSSIYYNLSYAKKVEIYE